MAPTYMDGLHTMAWLSLVGLVFLVLTALTLGCLWIGEHFPKGRIARFLFGPQLTVRVSNWRSEDEQKPQRILDALRQQTPPPVRLVPKASVKGCRAGYQSFHFPSKGGAA